MSEESILFGLQCLFENAASLRYLSGLGSARLRGLKRYRSRSHSDEMSGGPSMNSWSTPR